MTTAEQTWGSTTDAAGIARWLKNKRRVVIVTHTKPDGDAVGSSLALARALNIEAGGEPHGFGVGPARATCWYSGPTPPWLHAIAGQTPRVQIDGPDAITAAIASDEDEPDAVVVVDTGAWSQLEPVADWLRSRQDRVAVIDHHLRGDAEVGQTRLVETAASAACEIVAGVCARVLGLSSPAELPESVAEPAYLGVYTDTGSFRHSNVTPATHRLAADLIAAGVDHERLGEILDQQDKPSRLRLLARALDRLEYHDDESIALMALTLADFENAGAAQGESGGFLDTVRCVATVRVAALLTEQAPTAAGPLTKISLRSKGGPGMIDVNVVAGSLGGGGHAQAAGARYQGTIDQTRAALLAALRDAAGTAQG